MRPRQNAVRKNKTTGANHVEDLETNTGTLAVANDPNRRAGELDREKSQLIEENTRLQRALESLPTSCDGYEQ
jgi:hypothetical protein